LYLFFCFETRSPYVSQAGLELVASRVLGLQVFVTMPGL
jgi:hypothetical protein